VLLTKKMMLLSLSLSLLRPGIPRWIHDCSGPWTMLVAVLVLLLWIRIRSWVDDRLFSLKMMVAVVASSAAAPELQRLWV